MPTTPNSAFHQVYAALLERAHRLGLEALAVEDATELARLFVLESQKGAFVSGSDSDAVIVARFLEHVRAQFAEDVDLRVVVDYQPKLKRSAALLAADDHPIEAVILYATWIEHWVNGVLLTVMSRTGKENSDAVDMLRQAGFSAKLGWLWRLLALPPLPPAAFARVNALIEVRNEYVHYKWRGQSPESFEGPNQRLVSAPEDIDTTLRSLLEWESEHIGGPALREAKRIFGVDLTAEWRTL